MTRLVSLISIFVFASAASAQSRSGDPLRALDAADIFNLESASDPRISPDGDHVVYVRRTNDIATDTTKTSLWLIDVETGDQSLLGTGDYGSSQPRWSPDGAQIAYVTSRDGETEIRLHDLASSRDRELTSIEGGLSGLAWSPSGDALAFARFIPEAGARPAELPARDPNYDWAAGAQVEDRLVFRLDGVGNLPPGNQQIYMVRLADGEPERLTQDALGAGADLRWSVDGSMIYFSADRRENAGTLAPDAEIFSLNIDDGEIRQITDRRGPDASPRPSPDGRWVAYTGFDDRRMGYHNTRLYLARPDGSDVRVLTADLDRAVANPMWDADGTGIYFQYVDHGITRVARVDLEGRIQSVVDGLGGSGFGRPYSGGSFSVADDGRLAATIAPAQHPGEIAIGDRETGLQAVTSNNADVLAGIHISHAEDMRWNSPHDGREIQGWILYPPGFDPTQRYPMILEIHGGPFSAYGPVFSAELQLMAAAGYVVFYTNPRGSTSYGDEFANLIHHDYPGNDYDDLIGGVDALIERGFIDEDRLFVTGGSGGGVLTAWIIGNTDRFAAAAVAKPVINWASFVLYSDLPQFFYRYWFASAPWEDPEEYWRRSPLSLVGNVNTPTMIMVGGADVRTPRAESEQYYSALRLRGVPSRFVVIPDSYHSIAESRPSRLLTKVAEILRWFETYDPANDTAAAEAGAAE